MKIASKAKIIVLIKANIRTFRLILQLQHIVEKMKDIQLAI